MVIPKTKKSFYEGGIRLCSFSQVCRTDIIGAPKIQEQAQIHKSYLSEQHSI